MANSERDIYKAYRAVYGGDKAYDSNVIFGMGLNSKRIGKEAYLLMARVPDGEINKYCGNGGRACFTSEFFNGCTNIVVNLTNFPDAKYFWISKCEEFKMRMVLSCTDQDQHIIKPTTCGLSCLDLQALKQENPDLIAINIMMNPIQNQKIQLPYWTSMEPLYKVKERGS